MTKEPESVASKLVDVAKAASTLVSAFIESGTDVLSEDTAVHKLGHSKRSEALLVVERLVSAEVIERNGSLLRLQVDFRGACRIRDLLLGATLASLGNKDRPPQVVLTPPSSPCLLSQELAKRGPRTTRIADTREVFQHLAHEAKSRLIVMTPFLDELGAKFLLDVFKRTSDSVERILILRFLAKGKHYQTYPEGFDVIERDLAQLGVRVFDYAIPRANTDWLETFHAKVLIADRSLAYIGSANINRHSLENSMEVGVLLSDSTSLRSLLDVMETVLRISTKT